MSDTKLETLAFPCGAHNQFTGTKTVFAEACNRGSYNKLRGWQIPADENPEDAGYLHTSEDGHVTWTPAAVFEAMFQRSGDHIDRMRIEHGDLTTRVNALAEFIAESEVYENLPGPDQALLSGQFAAMCSYAAILALRLDRIH